MTVLFLKIINMSISASWLILAVLLLRPVLKKAPKWGNVLLWGIVAVRLVCPFSIESALSLIPSAETVSPDIMMAQKPTIQTGIPAMNNVVNPVISETFAPEQFASANPLQIWIPVLACIWLLGMALLLAYTAISYWRLRRRVCEAVILRDNIYQCGTVGSPFVLGLIRPKIYLPYNLDGQDMSHVLAHEQVHIRRWDHWWKPLGFLLLTVHWFNPLMWLAYVLLCRDIELACDERVIRELGSEQRADYTQALVACSVNRRMIASCPLAFGEVGVKERVKSVMNYKKPVFWVVVASVIACVVVAVCFLTNPSTRETMTWAQTLSAENIASVDLVVFPQAENRQFKQLTDDEIAEMTALINQSKGKYLREHEDMDGGSIFFYLTMKDGTTHEVGNIGNTYLVIDDDYYDADYRWLASWDDEFGEGNLALPIGYFSGPSVRQWFDYLDIPSEMEAGLTTELAEYPGVTFEYTKEQIIASKPFNGSDMTGHTILISGMPIWNCYLCDLTGDGLPDLCATYTYGSGIIDSRVVIYDYANGVSYELVDRGNYDYTLRLGDDGLLFVDKKDYDNGKLISTGRLAFKDNCIQVFEEAVGSSSIGSIDDPTKK